MNDKRREKRHLAYIGGRACFDHGQSSADLLIRNISNSGAKLVVHNGHFVPDRFKLVVPKWKAEYLVNARWRRYDEIGVELVWKHLQEIEGTHASDFGSGFQAA